MVTGFAGLLAGAFSMAVGEFTSVASQRDILARQVDLERRELAGGARRRRPPSWRSSSSRRGSRADQAARTAAELLKNPEHALDTLVREELGLDPEDLGSPWGAAGSSFATFAVGAFIPVVPFFFLQRDAGDGGGVGAPPASCWPAWAGWSASWRARRPGSRRRAWSGSPRSRAGPPGPSGGSSARRSPDGAPAPLLVAVPLVAPGGVANRELVVDRRVDARPAAPPGRSRAARAGPPPLVVAAHRWAG